MKASRCSSCNINYPFNRETCLVCKQETWRVDGSTWDDDWKNKVRILQNRWVIGEPLPNVDAVVYEVKGHLFIADAMLQNYGYLDVNTDSIVMIQNRYFEVNGKVKGKNEGWWIKEVKPEDEFKEPEFRKLPTLSGLEYDRLQKKRIRP